MDDFPSTLWPEGTHLALTRAALLDGEPATAAFREWRDNIVFDDLDGGSFRLLPLLRWNMGRLGVKDPLLARIDSACRFQFLETTMKLDALRRLALALHGMNIAMLLLKGASLGQRYYPNPSLRPMADCDLLIPPEERDRALEGLRAAGWQSGGYEESLRHYSIEQWHPPHPMIQVELHWRSGIQATLHDDKMAWEASEETEFRGVPCRAFCPEDEIIHACRHGFNWTPHTPPMRWLADCAMIVRRRGADMDWDRLASRARAMEETPAVLHSLEWLRREGCAEIPEEALRTLRRNGTTRRERRIHELKTKPRDWAVTARLYAAFLGRELPWWRWPFHFRSVTEYFAGQFALADHADTFRYFIYHFRREAGLRGWRWLENLISQIAPASGMRRITATWLRENATSLLEEPAALCWSRRKIRLEGFSYAHDAGATGALRVNHEGRELASISHCYTRVDIAKREPRLPAGFKAGFVIVADLPAGSCELVVEHRRAEEWKPLLAVQIEEIHLVKGSLIPVKSPLFPARLDFGDSRAEKYLVSGWSLPEGPCRWSDGKKAEIIFGLEKIEPLTLEIKMRPFLPSKRRNRQNVAVFLNGRKICTWNLRAVDAAVFTAQLPRELLRTGNLLTFRLPQAASPAGMGLSHDTRKLAIHVEWMKLSTTGAASKIGGQQS
ncbi:MAG TPA: nucleotidyltransferase family protein [Chthoniobacteraceae bacterium]|nr:nucleotidyltransferase family protein [Chthoniobacteraceae bacterium]